MYLSPGTKIFGSSRNFEKKNWKFYFSGEDWKTITYAKQRCNLSLADFFFIFEPIRNIQWLLYVPSHPKSSQNSAVSRQIWHVIIVVIIVILSLRVFVVFLLLSAIVWFIIVLNGWVRSHGKVRWRGRGDTYYRGVLITSTMVSRC